MDFALDTDGDLDVSTGEVTLTDGAEAIRQHLQIRLRFVKGDWFLDTDVGVPYFEKILVKNPDLTIVRSLYRRAILGTPGIASLSTFALEIDRATRKLTLSFAALADTGETITFTRFVL